VHPLSRLHVMTIVAAEQQTMNYYMNHGPDFMDPVARKLYAEIAHVEEEHVTHYGSLLDPLDSWLKQLVFHEYNECYLYHSMLMQESDARIKAIWERHLDMEIGQLRAAADLLRTYEGTDAEEILPAGLPDVPLTFETNKAYVREVLANTVDLRMDGLGYTPVDDLPKDHRFWSFSGTVNAGGAPSDVVLIENIEQNGRDYRDETEGPNPVVDLREPPITTELTKARS
jgi:hypothetical protein